MDPSLIICTKCHNPQCAKETTQNLVKSQSTVTHMGWGEAANAAVSGITEHAGSERIRVLPRQVPPHTVPREGLQNPEPSSFPGICSCPGKAVRGLW